MFWQKLYSVLFLAFTDLKADKEPSAGICEQIEIYVCVPIFVSAFKLEISNGSRELKGNIDAKIVFTYILT